MTDDKIKTSFFDIPKTNDKFHQAKPLESPSQDDERCQLPFKLNCFPKVEQKKSVNKIQNVNKEWGQPVLKQNIWIWNSLSESFVLKK